MIGNMCIFILMVVLIVLVMGMGGLIGGISGVIIVLVVVGVGNIWVWWNSDKVMLCQQGVYEVMCVQVLELVDMVVVLVQCVNLFMFKVYVLEIE